MKEDGEEGRSTELPRRRGCVYIVKAGLLEMYAVALPTTVGLTYIKPFVTTTSKEQRTGGRWKEQEKIPSFVRCLRVELGVDFSFLRKRCT